MFPIAHLASAVLVNRLVYDEDRIAPAAVGALLPDLVDKTLAWVLHVTQSSHHIAHTPLAAVGLSLVAARFWGKGTARLFGSAYITHLVGDEVHHGRVPWRMPFSSQRRRDRAVGAEKMRLRVVGILIEVPASLLLLALSRPSNRPSQR